MLTNLKVLWVFWLLSVAGVVTFPVVGVMTGDEAIEKMGGGTAQVVLSIVVGGLSLSIVWLTKRLLQAMEDRVKEATLRTEDAHRMHKEQQEVLRENSVATSSNATASQQLKEAVYHLAKCVDKCPGPTSDELMTRDRLPQ